MAKLSQLTDNSWFMKTNADELGYLFKNKDGYLFLSPNGKTKLKDFDDLEKTYGQVTYLEREVQTQDNISGYPVRHEDIKVISEDPPTYVKNNTFNTSDIKFLAGYWSIKYPKGWTLALCPKLSTTEEYSSEGPFRTKLECVNNNQILNTRESTG